MFISVDELKIDPLQYIALRNPNIIITHEGKEVARLINIHDSALDPGNMTIEERIKMATSLVGILPDTVDLDAIREERLLKN